MPSRYYKPKLTQEERRQRRKEAVQDLVAGMSCEDVCAKHNISIRTLGAARQEFGVMKGKYVAGKNFSSYQLIADFINTDETLCSLAARYGVSRQRVSEIYARCVEVGIPVRKRAGGMLKKGG